MRKQFAVLALLSAWAAAGQTTSGRIVGSIQDNTGAVVPGATVKAVNVETGAERSATSNAEGQYLLYPLAPGVYRMTAQMTGFQMETWDNIRIDVADTVV